MKLSLVLLVLISAIPIGFYVVGWLWVSYTTGNRIVSAANIDIGTVYVIDTSVGPGSYDYQVRFRSEKSDKLMLDVGNESEPIVILDGDIIIIDYFKNGNLVKRKFEIEDNRINEIGDL